MDRIINVDLDEDFIRSFFGLTESTAPENITISELKTQINAISDKMKVLTKRLKKYEFSSQISEEAGDENLRQAILIIDDLGIITYQLKVLISKLGFEIDTSQEVFEAILKFKQRPYQFVIMDLFIPTDREGFILLDELKKISEEMNTGTIIGVITASARKEHPKLCKQHGANFFMEKVDNWQQVLYNKIQEYVDMNSTEETGQPPENTSK